MKYLTTRNKSLEDSVLKVLGGLSEKKLDPVNPQAVKKKFDDRKDKDLDNDGDTDSTDKYLHKRRKAISKAIKNERVSDVDVDQAKRDLKHAKIQKKISDVKKEETELDEIAPVAMAIGRAAATGAGAAAANRVMDKVNAQKKKKVDEDEKMKKLTKRQRDALARVEAQPKSKVSLPKMPDFMKTKKEAYEIGNDYAKHTLNVTPGQDSSDVDEMLGIMQKKTVSMREALAKVWGMDEGKNPFKKDLTKETKNGKTMTGQKPTKVEVDPKIEEK